MRGLDSILTKSKFKPHYYYLIVRFRLLLYIFGVDNIVNKNKFKKKKKQEPSQKSTSNQMLYVYDIAHMRTTW